MSIIDLTSNKTPSLPIAFPFSYPQPQNPSKLTQSDPPKTFHLPPKPSRSSKNSVICLTEDDLPQHDTDLWLIFDNPHLKTPPHNVIISLKNQFESTNIVKISQAFHLETCPFSSSHSISLISLAWNPEDILITGWKLHDPSLLYSIITKAKPLSFSYNGFPLKHYLIGTVGQLQRFLKQRRQDEKLNQSELFTKEYATPLLSLHLQGLFYYEFDYVDIAPDALCVLCGVPPHLSDEDLTAFITQNSLPKPVNILRNPLEGLSNVRVTFPEAPDADLFKFQGLKIPITGAFSSCKPIIILPVKDREFDFTQEITKFQVMLSFEGENEVEYQAQIQVLKEIEDKYGPVSDVTIIFSRLWVVSFEGINSAVRCLEGANKANFSLRVSISKPAKPYPCSGFLFQQKGLPLHDTQMPQRPPELIKTDPKNLKIKSQLFEKSLLLKRRYQKIYSRQLGTIFLLTSNNMIEEAQKEKNKENKENSQEGKSKEKEEKEQVKVKDNRRKKAKAKKVELAKEKHQSRSDELELMEELKGSVLTCKKVKISLEDKRSSKEGKADNFILGIIYEAELQDYDEKNSGNHRKEYQTK